MLADKLGVKLEALVIGDKLDGIENGLYPYGVDTVYKVAISEGDAAFLNFITRRALRGRHSAALHRSKNLSKNSSPTIP